VGGAAHASQQQSARQSGQGGIAVLLLRLCQNLLLSANNLGVGEWLLVHVTHRVIHQEEFGKPCMAASRLPLLTGTDGLES